MSSPRTDASARRPPRRRLPTWIRTRPPGGGAYARLKRELRERGLATVCEEARCPNVHECWADGTATVMVLGEICTRGCRFCAVQTRKRPPAPDPEEPEQVARMISGLGLRYVVLTMVDRDDLPDGGADHVGRCVEALRRAVPELLVEALVSDFRGQRAAVERVVRSGPAVFAHNIETVERLTPRVRDPRCGYRQSLEVLRFAKERAPSGQAMRTKSSIMLGLGERPDELEQAFADLRAAGVDVLTLGQYLRPTPKHLAVEEFVPPERFDALAERARAHGFEYVAAGPLVRSSYRAAELYLERRLRSRAGS
ncbi:MAG: lipoyl synthase [Planctomycetota bacterium]|nr:MAG: lipoyl synthase [Planctomycetota bacterium]